MAELDPLTAALAMEELESANAPNVPPPIILVVDDEASIRTMLRLVLTRAGYEVVEAEDGERALERIEETLPDVVILDVMMPGIGGFALCQTLRENPHTADLPVIMLSARTDSRSRQAGLRAGATKYLTKPLAAEQLLRHVAEALETAVS